MVCMAEIEYYFIVFIIVFWSFAIGFMIGETNGKNIKKK